ncbi:Bifunctional uridylyltransferase/uridylyl-removing enzyme [Nymphon striatum]|nr:Bifunctional uridylyltransferase/uridylyl-removing enzyme [Nymphon striatum]
MNFLKEADEQGLALATSYETKQFEAITEITVVAQDHPRLLSIIAGACVAAGAERIGNVIEEVLSGQAYLPDVIARNNKPKKGYKAFRITPAVEINNDLSDNFTVIEIECLDRPGLLSELTGALSDLNLDIGSAHVVTFGEKANDSFYVRDLIGDKITNKKRLEKITNTLVDVMAQTQPKEKVA